MMDVYEGWQRFAERMERYWLTRKAQAEKTLRLVGDRDPSATRFLGVYLQVIESERQQNRRLQLLMLLRGRARELLDGKP